MKTLPTQPTADGNPYTGSTAGCPSTDNVPLVRLGQKRVIDQVNQLVFRLDALELLNDQLLLSPMVLARGRLSGAGDDHEVIQAGLCSERGLVAVVWDAEDFNAFQNFDREAMVWAAQARSTPLAKCDGSIVLRVAQQAQGLLNDLLASFELFPSDDPQ